MSRFLVMLSYALRDASRSRVVLALIIISLSISSTSVLSTTAILDGFNQTLESGAIDADGHIVVNSDKSTFTPIENIEEVKAELRKIENIESFSVRSYALGGVNLNGDFVSAYVLSEFKKEDEEKTTELPDRIIEGRMFKPGQNEVVIGTTLAGALVGLEYDDKKIEVNQDVNLIFYTGRQEKFKVVGILDAKTFHPNWTVYFPEGKLTELDASRKNSEIAIKLKDESKMDETKKEILDKIPGISAATWKEKAAYIDDIMSAVSFITNLIGRLLVVAVFIIISIIVFISVSQKKRQIGIMKSMGATNLFIITIFVTETLIYSILAFAIGFLMFLIIHIYATSNPIPLLIGDFVTVFDKENILRTIAILFLAAIGGSFIPGYLAAKTRIADIIIDRS